MAWSQQNLSNWETAQQKPFETQLYTVDNTQQHAIIELAKTPVFALLCRALEEDYRD